jgi:hypothetical protein
MPHAFYFAITQEELEEFLYNSFSKFGSEVL